jgi:K+ potassium transporter
MVAFATIATVIASQSIISGAYSLTQQAMQLGFLPRMRVQHTASHEKGLLYDLQQDALCGRGGRSRSRDIVPKVWAARSERVPYSAQEIPRPPAPGFKMPSKAPRGGSSFDVGVWLGKARSKV